MNVIYHLKLKDGSARHGVHIPNKYIKEKIWRTSEGFVFEDAVEAAIELKKQDMVFPKVL